MTRPTQLTLPFAVTLSYAPENFVHAPENEEASKWLNLWPRWPVCGLIVQGPRGCGKTHLAHGWAARSGAVFLDANQVSSLSTSAVIEDLETLQDDEGLFHALNRAKEEGHFLLLTARDTWSEKQVQLPDLASRLKALPHIFMHAPGDQLLQWMLEKILADLGVVLTSSQKTFVLQLLERSGSAVQHFAQSLHSLLLQHPQRVTQRLLREIIEQGGSPECGIYG